MLYGIYIVFNWWQIIKVKIGTSFDMEFKLKFESPLSISATWWNMFLWHTENTDSVERLPATNACVFIEDKHTASNFYYIEKNNFAWEKPTSL